jgi:transcriptional regulator with XRE-family HTH domain
MGTKWPRLTNKALAELRAELGQRIRACRKSRRMTQWQVADRLEMSRSTIAMIERGLQAVTVDQLHHLASLFETDADNFLKRGPLLWSSAWNRG